MLELTLKIWNLFAPSYWVSLTSGGATGDSSFSPFNKQDT